MASMAEDLVAAIRTIRDYPKEGILFRDITTLLGNPQAFRRAVDELVHPWAGSKIDKVAGIEARGFIFGAAVAAGLRLPFLPIRKPGKLPVPVLALDYALEYGTDTLEIDPGAVPPGGRVVLVDDLIATGGTAAAAARLLARAGAKIDHAMFVIDLPDLGGRKKLEDLGVQVRTLVSYEGH